MELVLKTHFGGGNNLIVLSVRFSYLATLIGCVHGQIETGFHMLPLCRKETCSHQFNNLKDFFVFEKSVEDDKVQMK